MPRVTMTANGELRRADAENRTLPVQFPQNYLWLADAPLRVPASRATEAAHAAQQDGSHACPHEQ